jgi:hypothetical protein
MSSRTVTRASESSRASSSRLAARFRRQTGSLARLTAVLSPAPPPNASVNTAAAKAAGSPQDGFSRRLDAVCAAEAARPNGARSRNLGPARRAGEQSDDPSRPRANFSAPGRPSAAPVAKTDQKAKTQGMIEIVKLDSYYTII